MNKMKIALLRIAPPAAFYLLFSGGALAQSTTSLPAESHLPAPVAADARVETYVSRHTLTGGFGNWREAGTRGWLHSGAHVFQGEVAAMHRFGQSGSFASVGDSYTFSPDWYGQAAVGAGDGAAYLPRYRVDGAINRKFLADRNLVGSAGLGYYRAPDGHIDRSGRLGAAYYASASWVFQGDVRFNVSNPGAVHTRQQFVAATWGREKFTQVTGRHGWGSEGYQSIGNGAVLANFRSSESSLAVRHWFGPRWGASLTVDQYQNPSYRRKGATVGLFWDFP